MIDDLEPLLQQLPEPAPPSSITAAVMARIAREAEDRQTAPVEAVRERPAWLWAFAGVALVLIVAFKGWLSTGSMPNFTSPRIGVGSPSLMPVQGPMAWLMAIGLLVYLAGLWAPLRRPKRD